MEQLPLGQRVVVEGLFWEQVSQSELAAREQVTQQAIARRKHRALNSLRRTLNGGAR